MKLVDIDVVITTYNQRNTITQAIESVLRQVTSYSVRIIIGDDYSTDGTLEICKLFADKHPDSIVLLQSDKNKGLIMNYLRCFEFVNSKYIAILEGDDYWIDENKLQSQCDILENNAKIGLVHTGYKIYNEFQEKFQSTKLELTKYSQTHTGLIYMQLLSLNHICAGTAVFRSSFVKDLDNSFLLQPFIKTIDYYIWLKISQETEIAYLNHITTVYRISRNSISNSLDFNKARSFIDSTYSIIEYFVFNFPRENIFLKSYQYDRDMKLFLLFVKYRQYFMALDNLNYFRFKQFFSFLNLRRNFR